MLDGSPLRGEDIFCCPRCKAMISAASEGAFICSNPACECAKRAFPTVIGQPVLIDFEESVFEPSAFQDGRGSVLPRDDSGRGFRTRFRAFIAGSNPVAERNAVAFVKHAKSLADRPAVLIIGGGAIGVGTDQLYNDTSLRVVGTDVYASPHTTAVADAHRLPFRDGVFAAVWIQAVLEHVLEPATVVSEIYRVLQPNGIVYAETPFMQQVHEGAYDFTRFTLSGHRWLFRRFEQIDAGVVGVAGTSAVWSVRYLWRSLGVGNKLATLFTLPFFWLRFLDLIARGHHLADGACGVFFLGSKSATTLSPKDIVGYYASQV
jgi:SAM-dependent methyltransferase